MSATSRLGLPLIEAAQAQKHVPHNEALRALDFLVQAVALDRDRTAPPASPSEGDLHLVAAAPTGAWADRAHHFAVSVAGGWNFLAPRTGWCVWIVAESLPVVWTGSAWVPLPEAIGAVADLAGVGIGTAPDTTNRLAVRSAAALFAAEATSGGGSGDVRLTVEKESAAHTASLLFQSDWSGRAEIGLAGDDDLSVKVSADGATWIDALRIVAATGQIVPGPGGLAGGARLRATTWMTATGTWTRPSGVHHVLVVAVGAGGGGGGASGAASSGSAGAGGGAGAMAVSFLDVSGAGYATVTVTIGAAGTGGASAGGSGGAGGSSSFGADVVAGGGAGGTGMTAGTSMAMSLAGLGGTASAGDMLFAGSPGSPGLRLDAATNAGGNGGASFFGGGARGVIGNYGGVTGTARGSGGSGGVVSSSTNSRTGGPGAAGAVWIWEFD